MLYWKEPVESLTTSSEQRFDEQASVLFLSSEDTHVRAQSHTVFLWLTAGHINAPTKHEL